MGPIDYSTQVQSPFAAALQGYQLGSGIRADQLAQQQQQAALAQQQKQQQVLQALLTNKNPTANDYAQATILVPQLKDNFKQAWEMKNTDQQQSMLRDAGQYYAAVASGQPQIAVQQMRSRADAMAAAGAPKQEVDALRANAAVVEAHPEFARTQLGLMLASLPGGDKVIAGATSLGGEQRASDQAPADLAIKNATAGIKGVEAANAPTKVGLENANAAEDVETKRANREIASLNTQIAQANSETQRGELILKRDEWTQKLQQTQQAKSQSAQDAVDTLTQTRDTVKSLMAHPGLKGWFGAGTIGGKQAAMIPGTDAKDFRAQIETLKAQNFQSQIKTMVGLGALSDAEGSKLSAAIANLDPDQSEKQLTANLGVVARYLDKATAKQVASGNLPTTGGAFVMKHPIYGNVTDGTVNGLLAKFPGSTREQVIEYLNSTAKPGGATAVAPGSN